MVQRKKAISLLLILAILFTILPVGTLTALAAETPLTGTFVISNAEELVALGGQDIVGTIELAADLDLAGYDMAPIRSLTGAWEGNGYTISNLSLSGEMAGIWDPYVGVGLIARLNGTLQNLLLADVTVSTLSEKNIALGALVGIVDEGPATIRNCGVINTAGSSTVTGPNSSTSCYAGGLVGYISGTGSIVTLENCFSEAAVSSGAYAGGLIGAMAYGAQAELENCYAGGDVTIGSKQGGGILGFGNTNFAITATNCFFSGAITGNDRYGFAYVSRSGSNRQVILDNCYYDSDKNYGTSSWSPFEITPATSYVTGTMAGVATGDFVNLELGTAFTAGVEHPTLAWVEELDASGADLTIEAADASSVTLEKDGQTYEMIQSEAGFTYAGLAAGVYDYTALSAVADKATGRGQVVVGKLASTKTIQLPAKGVDTQLVLTPAYGSLELYQGNDTTGALLTPDQVEDGLYTYSLYNGTYTYRANAFGHEAAQGSFTVPVEQGQVAISLTPLATTEVAFQISCGVETPVITVSHDAIPMAATAADASKYQLPDGDYQFTVSAPGYLPQSGQFTVPGDSQISLELVANQAWDGTTAKTLVGAGTEQEPYLISHGRELALLAEQVNAGDEAYASAYVELTNDIDLGNVSWTPIGRVSVSPFKGHFDGKGYTIRNLNVEDCYAYYGFFGCLTDATVENLTVAGEVYCPEPYGLVGGLAGYAIGEVTIRNCANLANVSALARGNVGTGGLVGGYDDGVDYKWVSVRLLLENCYNAGLVVATGADLNTTIGGLVGGNKNCVQLVDCYNIGVVYGPGVQAAGLLGNAGYQTGDDCYPSMTNCYNAGPVTGAADKEYALYGKGTIAPKRMVNCYALTAAAAVCHDGITVASASELAALAPTLGPSWTQEAGKNNGYPYLLTVKPAVLDTNLKVEADKYCDVIAAASSTAVGEDLTLLVDGAQADPAVTLTCIQTADDIQSGYLDCQDGAISLRKANTSAEAVTETATLQFANAYGRFRKPVSVIIYPAASMTETLLHNIAATYRDNSGDWVVFDMAAYQALHPEAANQTSEKAKQNYLNLTLNALATNSALVTDRAKAEIILHSLGVDSRELYALGSEAAFDNAAKLQIMNLGSSYYAAPWVLLADQQGRTNLSASQIKSMVDLLVENQGTNGLFYSIWGTTKYDDVDTTGTALAAMARFYLATNDPYGVKASVTKFVEQAVAGLSKAQGSNGSYGNVNSDAMVITGLTALGIDPGQDSRFVKNGCSLADALFLYVNQANNGFTSAYLSGIQGEKAQALATEQGFRALIALCQFQKDPGMPFNIYAFDAVAGSVPSQQPGRADGVGEVDSSVTIPVSDRNISVGFTVKPSDDSQWLSASSITVPEGATVYHVFTKALEDADMTSAGAEDNYVKSITKSGVTLSQFDAGPNSGWMYQVNGKVPSVGLQDYTLKQGDQVVFFYTKEWTKQSGTSHWGGGSAVTVAQATATTSKLTPQVTLDTNGNATVMVADDSITAALALLDKDAAAQLIIAPTGGEAAKQIAVTLSKTAIAAIAAKGKTELLLQTSLGNLALQQPALDGIAKQAGNTLTITLAKKAGDTLGITIALDGKALDRIEGGLLVAIPVQKASAALVLALVDANGGETLVKKSVIVGDALTARLAWSCDVKVLENAKSFTDVPASLWSKDAIAFVASRELFNGTSATTFEPEAVMTRGMFVTALHRLEDMPQGTELQFQDVADDAWFSQAVAWAASKEIVSGVSQTQFEPERAVSREELASMFYRYAKATGMEVAKGGDLGAFTDQAAISTWAAEAMGWAVGCGLINGRTPDTLAPQELATRGEVAAMLQRFMANVVK